MRYAAEADDAWPPLFMPRARDDARLYIRLKFELLLGDIDVLRPISAARGPRESSH